MGLRFSSSFDRTSIVVSAWEKRFVFRKCVPVDDWLGASESARVAVACIMGLVESGNATMSGQSVELTHETAARLPGVVAETIGLPQVAPLSIKLSFEGNIGTSGNRIRCEWFDKRSRLVRPDRQGLVVTWGKETGRLTPSLFTLVNAIEGYNASSTASIEQRITAWQPVQEALRHTIDRNVKTDGFLESLTIYQAGSFALDVRETNTGPDFVPILMSRSKAMSLEDNAPVGEGQDEDDFSVEPTLRSDSNDALLPPLQQRKFARQCFEAGLITRDAYVLSKNTFVVVDPDLKIALDVVRRKRLASDEERRHFVRNPRPSLIEALEREGRETPAISLFVETQQYSDRILGLGIWEPPKLPWLKRQAGQWLPERFLSGGDDDTLTQSVDADGRFIGGEASSDSDDDDHRKTGDDLHVDAELGDSDEGGDITAVGGGESDDAGGLKETAPARIDDRQVLCIKTNVDGVEYHLEHPPRRVQISRDLPQDRLGDTVPKPHQTQGFAWLLQAWAAGWPGVLLADDMGLGKTFQALAFLAWLQKNRYGGRLGAELPKGPILVVGPTALLRNWLAEAEKHLASGALGECVEAFGSGLAKIRRRKNEEWTPEDSVDVEILRSGGWVLTTYETLADNHRAFARVGFAVAVFDEMQKIKVPGTINTLAAKAINADFVIGLTGTPIENRIEDLWCIMDRIAPGYLGDLKRFSVRYGQEQPAALNELKKQLDTPQGTAPAIMLRRMKDTILEGLPRKVVKSYPVEMPSPQAEAYSQAINAARGGMRNRGTMLEVIHALRSISLHPTGAQDVEPYDSNSVWAWVKKSARLSRAVALLQNIQTRSEKAIVFVEDLAVQKVVATSSVLLFNLAKEPSVINGSVPGAKRQEIVDRFQAGPRGFDLLILSPKAAGLGLTITAANHVIHLSRWWNPAVEDQCNDRVYRIGQDRDVTIHIPMAKHPELGSSSFDIILDKLLGRKRELSQHMLAPPVQESDIDHLFSATMGE